jgi:hypothetical protein
MDNQHRQIIGYRELTQEDIDLMNRIKAAGNALLELQREVAAKLGETDGSTHARRAAAHNAMGGSYMKPRDPVDPEITRRFAIAEPHRWAAIAKTDIQTGIMALVRAVAQPVD